MIESEKTLERYLKRQIEDKLGGWYLKLLSQHISGLPDRLCLLPGGVLFFAEIKTTKKKPTKLQQVMHRKLRNLGFTVEVIDRTSQITEMLKNYNQKC